MKKFILFLDQSRNLIGGIGIVCEGNKFKIFRGQSHNQVRIWGTFRQALEQIGEDIFVSIVTSSNV